MSQLQREMGALLQVAERKAEEKSRSDLMIVTMGRVMMALLCVC
jgi:hypothetical protein